MDEESEIEKIEKLERIAQSDRSSRMNKFLANEPPEVQLRIRETVDTWGIDPEDPFFIVLIQCKIVQILYDLTPNRINRSFDTGLNSIRDTLEEYKKSLLEIQQTKLEEISQAALKQSTAKLDNAIARILEDNNISYQKSRFSPRVVGAMVTAGAMALSLVVGFIGGGVFDRTTVVKNWQQHTQAEDLLLLQWAKSSQGQFAKNLLEWNDDLYGKSCQKKAQNLGISFTVGSLEMIDGFCVVHVVPESQRRYKNKE